MRIATRRLRICGNSIMQLAWCLAFADLILFNDSLSDTPWSFERFDFPDAKISWRQSRLE